MLIFISVFGQAPDEEQLEKNTEMDYTDPAAVNGLSPQDLITAIEQGKIKDLSVVNDQNLVAALSNKLSLIDKNSNVLDELNKRTQNSPAILNEHTEIKKEWFGHYSITDEGAGIENFDGINVKTSGPKSTTFALEGVSGAKVLQDGSLVIKNAIISGTTGFSQKKEGDLVAGYEVQGGTVLLNQDAAEKEIIPFNVKEGEVKIIKKNMLIIYAGSFSYAPEYNLNFKQIGPFEYQDYEIGSLVQGTFTRQVVNTKMMDDQLNPITVSSMKVEGAIFQQQEFSSNEMIFVGNTKIIKTDGTFISVEAEKTYYTEKLSRSAASFCKREYSCVVNTPTTSSLLHGAGYRDRLAFINVQDNDKILVKTPVYFNHVEVIDQQNGLVTFQSVDNQGKLNAEVVAEGGHSPKLTGGKLENIKTGRFDVMLDIETCQDSDCKKETVVHHWSSNKFQKDKSYFYKPRDHFVTCAAEDCEEEFAKAFGVVIAPKDPSKKPSTTVIVGGDNAYTPKSLINYCKTEGCYIVNSRDTPPTTTSSNLIITGHHFKDTDYVWRDPEEVFGDHQPIDILYFGDRPYSSPFDSLPKEDPNNPIRKIAFSACNTAVPEGYNGFEKLQEKYKNLNSIQGWNGQAIFKEGIKSLPETSEERAKQATGSLSSKELPYGGKGERSWYYPSCEYGSYCSWWWTNGRGKNIKLSSMSSTASSAVSAPQG